MRDFISRNREILAFVLLALVTMLALNAVVMNGNDVLYESQLKQCADANKIIAESNRRIDAHRADTKALRLFMQGARTARLASYRQTHHRSDLVAGRTYGRLIHQLDAKVHFVAIPQVNCRKTVPKP